MNQEPTKIRLDSRPAKSVLREPSRNSEGRPDMSCARKASSRMPVPVSARHVQWAQWQLIKDQQSAPSAPLANIRRTEDNQFVWVVKPVSFQTSKVLILARLVRRYE